jgi:hypothetical protein
MLTDSNAISLLQRKFRYIIARWGYSPAVFVWELWNEVDQLSGYWDNIGPVGQWHQMMADWIRAHDPFQHPVTTSFGTGLYGELSIWSSCDYISLHHYNAPDEAEMTMADVRYTRHMFGSKPIFHGETGTEWDYHRADWNSSYLLYLQDRTGLSIRNWAWGSLFASAASTPLPWWWDVWVDRYQFYSRWLSIVKFVADEDLASQGYTSHIIPVTAAAGVRTLGYIEVQLGASTQFADMNKWGMKAAENTFYAYDNTITPAQQLIPRYYWGFNPPRVPWRNPTAIMIDCPTPACTFVIVVDNFNSATLVLWIDGVAESHALSAKPTVVSISLSQGKHNVTLDATGDWLSVSKLHIPTAASPLRAYAMVSDIRVLGWIKAINHTWNGVYTGQALPSSNDVTGSKMVVTLPAPQAVSGQWSISWWDTDTGAVSSLTSWPSPTGTSSLTLELPPIGPSVNYSRAFKLSFSAADTAEKTSPPPTVPSITTLAPTATHSPTSMSGHLSNVALTGNILHKYSSIVTETACSKLCLHFKGTSSIDRHHQTHTSIFTLFGLI